MSNQARIYLDWNATAPLLKEVREAMIQAIDSLHGNASSIHHEGQMARAAVERARRAVARAVNAPMQAVVLTGGATESNNQVLRHHVRTHSNARIVCTSVEHPSVIEVVDSLGKQGTQTEIWPVNDKGQLDLAWLDGALERGASCVSIMWANNEIGNVYPVKAIAERVHASGALLHVDATQAFGRINVDFGEAEIDYMTLSFHKMGGPKGIGAIVVREGLKVEAMLSGGHQERGRRPGTENIPAAAGLEAAAIAVTSNLAGWQEVLKELRSHFVSQLQTLVSGVELRGDVENQLPNTLNLAFEGIDGEDLLLALDLEGVSASSGSACTAGSLEPSHVVLAMGYPPERARQSVRFSFGPMTTLQELDIAVERIAAVVARLRQLAA